MSCRSDIAKDIIAQHKGESLPTPEELRKVRWKIDLYLLPLLCWVYALQYLDKVSYGQSANFGALVDLELQTTTATGGSDLSRFRDGSMIFWTGCKCTTDSGTTMSAHPLISISVIAGVYPVCVENFRLLLPN